MVSESAWRRTDDTADKVSAEFLQRGAAYVMALLRELDAGAAAA